MKSYRLAEVADLLGADLVGDPECPVEGIRPLDQAGPEHLSFLHNPKYVAQAVASHAGAIMVHDADQLAGRNLLICREPYLAVAKALELFHPRARPEPGIHPSAEVGAEFELGADASIGRLVAVGDGVFIGDRTVIGAGCVIGDGVRIGEDCVLHPRAVVEDGCRLGDRCIVQSGAVIGSDGYGFATVDGIHHKVPQVGIVVLEDDVEVQANTTVDRATMGETRIGRGTKIDNLVQVAHNVEVGEHCLFVSQVGVSGSTKIGRYTVLGGQAGVSGHVEVGERTMAAARTGITKSVPAGSVLAGFPARPKGEWMKAEAALQRLGMLRKSVADLEHRLAALEDQLEEKP